MKTGNLSPIVVPGTTPFPAGNHCPRGETSSSNRVHNITTRTQSWHCCSSVLTRGERKRQSLGTLGLGGAVCVVRVEREAVRSARWRWAGGHLLGKRALTRPLPAEVFLPAQLLH